MEPCAYFSSICTATVRQPIIFAASANASIGGCKTAYISGLAYTAKIAVWLSVIGSLGVLGYPVLDGHLPPVLSLKVLSLELSARANTHTLFLTFLESGF